MAVKKIVWIVIILVFVVILGIAIPMAFIMDNNGYPGSSDELDDCLIGSWTTTITDPNFTTDLGNGTVSKGDAVYTYTFKKSGFVDYSVRSLENLYDKKTGKYLKTLNDNGEVFNSINYYAWVRDSLGKYTLYLNLNEHRYGYDFKNSGEISQGEFVINNDGNSGRLTLYIDRAFGDTSTTTLTSTTERKPLSSYTNTAGSSDLLTADKLVGKWESNNITFNNVDTEGNILSQAVFKIAYIFNKDGTGQFLICLPEDESKSNISWDLNGDVVKIINVDGEDFEQTLSVLTSKDKITVVVDFNSSDGIKKIYLTKIE